MIQKRGEKLAEALIGLVKNSADITGAAIVGIDGLVYSAYIPQRTLDEQMVGASSAAVLGLSKRSVKQLKRGNLQKTLIQGDEGNIIVANIDEETLFVGLTGKDVNLGMAYAEINQMTNKLYQILRQ